MTLASLAPDASRIDQVVHSCWAIKNTAHGWSDMEFFGDEGRVLNGHNDPNLAALRKLVRRDLHRSNRSIRVQQKRAGLDMTVF